MWVPNLFSTPPADSAAKVGGRKKKQWARGCNLKDSAVGFMNPIAQAVSTLREGRGRKRNTHTNPLTITISIQTIAGSQWGINCPNQHSQLRRAGGEEGREAPTHLRNRIWTDRERGSYSLTQNIKVGKIKGVFSCSTHSTIKICPSVSSVPSLFWQDSCLGVYFVWFLDFQISSSHLRFSLKKNIASWNYLFIDTKGLTLETQFKELWYFQTAFDYQGKEDNEASHLKSTETGPNNNINIIYVCYKKAHVTGSTFSACSKTIHRRSLTQFKGKNKKISLRYDFYS